MSHQGNGALDALYIFLFQLNLCAGLRATCLHGCTAWKDADDFGAPILKDVIHRASETGAISQQQHYSGDPPCHTEHGQSGTPQIVAHRLVCLSQKILEHCYSLLMASTGCKSAALRAG